MGYIQRQHKKLPFYIIAITIGGIFAFVSAFRGSLTKEGQIQNFLNGIKEIRGMSESRAFDYMTDYMNYWDDNGTILFRYKLAEQPFFKFYWFEMLTTYECYEGLGDYEIIFHSDHPLDRPLFINNPADLKYFIRNNLGEPQGIDDEGNYLWEYADGFLLVRKTITFLTGIPENHANYFSYKKMHSMKTFRNSLKIGKWKKESVYYDKEHETNNVDLINERFTYKDEVIPVELTVGIDTENENQQNFVEVSVPFDSLSGYDSDLVKKLLSDLNLSHLDTMVTYFEDFYADLDYRDDGYYFSLNNFVLVLEFDFEAGVGIFRFWCRHQFFNYAC